MKVRDKPPRTTKLYDRTGDEITLKEVERIAMSIQLTRFSGTIRRNVGYFYVIAVDQARNSEMRGCQMSSMIDVHHAA
jgi:hypothetical protein